MRKKQQLKNDPWRRVADYLLSTSYVVEDALRALGLKLRVADWTHELWTQYDIDCCEGCSTWFDLEEMHQSPDGQLCGDCWSTRTPIDCGEEMEDEE